jgi:glycosyltransferase involved in cell wall biosynthesis
MSVIYDNVNKTANGGTELMLRGLESRISPELLDDVYICRSVDVLKVLPNDRIKIYWTHEVPATQETNFIEFNSFTMNRWQDFDRVVFVSNWQLNEYMKNYGFTWTDWDKAIVLRNAIDPIEDHVKPTDKIRLIYTSNPARGLDVLYEAFDKLSKKHDDVELEVFSSAAIYGMAEEDIQFKDLFDKLKSHKQIVYHPGAPNSEVREALKRSHIFAYPSTYGETSCISLIEAMSAKLLCVHPNQCALFETGGGMTNMYHYEKDVNKHVDVFYKQLDAAIEQYKYGDINHLPTQKNYVDFAYSWKNRTPQWESFLTKLRATKC